MTEKPSTPEVPDDGAAAAEQVATTAAGAGQASGATPPQTELPPAPPQPQPVPPVAPTGPWQGSSAPSAGQPASAGPWQGSPVGGAPAAPTPPRGRALYPSWTLVGVAALVAAILASLITGLVVNSRHDDEAARTNGSAIAPGGQIGPGTDGSGDLWNRMRDWAEQGGGSQATPTPAPSGGSGAVASRGYIGASVVDTAQGVSPAGAEVQQVQSGSPAANAGLAVGDVITSVDGKTVANVDDLMQILMTTKAGDQLSLAVSRGGQSMDVTVTTVGADQL